MILIITENRYENNPVVHCLQRISEQVDTTTTPNQALQRCLQHRYSVVVIDCHSSLTGYLQLLGELQAYLPSCAVLIVARQGCEAERITSLEMGAQDYIEYPFNPAEVQARVRVQLRRARQLSSVVPETHANAVKIGEFTIDNSYHSVEISGKSLELTAKEFALLHFLASHPDKVFSRNQLLSSVWGHHYGGYEHTINSHVNRLRTKLSKTSAGADLVETVWGVGYKFNSQSLRPSMAAEASLCAAS